MLRNQLHIASRNRKGFTLIELLVVVLIIGVLMAVALPLYLSVVADSQKKTCRTNMQTIADAVQAARMKSNANDYSAQILGGVTMATLPDLLAAPFCPNGGVYSLANGSTGTTETFVVKCNYGTGAGAHGTFEPGVNNY